MSFDNDFEKKLESTFKSLKGERENSLDKLE